MPAIEALLGSACLIEDLAANLSRSKGSIFPVRSGSMRFIQAGTKQPVVPWCDDEERCLVEASSEQHRYHWIRVRHVSACRRPRCAVGSGIVQARVAERRAGATDGA